jgi:hypothetical protein
MKLICSLIDDNSAHIGNFANLFRLFISHMEICVDSESLFHHRQAQSEKTDSGHPFKQDAPDEGKSE